eukprot:m.198016 g.198016  ORF g.198016 m.198016 type:complete len:602 (-) comp25113_c0_seq1:15-1820(-)
MAGIVRVAAAVVGGRTAIVDCTHCYPSRAFPTTPPEAAEVGAAGVIVSGHGGGLLGGDTYAVDVDVGDAATLLLQSQSATKVFQRREATNFRPTQTRTTISVGNGGLVVLAPDCIVPFRNSELHAALDLELRSPTASAVVVDAVSAGRVALGERWHLHRLTQKARYRRRRLSSSSDAGPHPSDAILDVALALHRGDAARMLDFAGVSHDAFASVVAVGPRAAAVIDHAESLRQNRMATEQPRRGRIGSTGPVPSWSLSVSRLDSSAGDSPAAVIKVVAQHAEQLYCSLRTVLSPLESALGVAPYRAHGLFHGAADNNGAPAAAAAVAAAATLQSAPCGATAGEAGAHVAEGVSPIAVVDEQMSPRALWHLTQLTDATLPTGGFAHSAGLEAAAQFGYLPTEQCVGQFVVAALQHSSRLALPFVAAAHRLHHSAATGGAASQLGALATECGAADHALDLQLRSNTVAHAASLEQGAALLRLIPSWDRSRGRVVSDSLREGHGHLPIVFGAVAAMFGVSVLQAAHGFQYTVARDLVASAVRMNLVGPTLGVQLLDRAFEHNGVSADLDTVPVGELIDRAAGCDVLIDTLQANHSQLYSRLFRS